MTIDTACAVRPSARAADLPRWDSLVLVRPDDLHRFHRLARELGPVAMGSLGPVALTYHTARTVLRERRFCRPDDLELARPYPIAVICELLGAPAQDCP